jgi:hypothetical protein
MLASILRIVSFSLSFTETSLISVMTGITFSIIMSMAWAKFPALDVMKAASRKYSDVLRQ